MMTLRQIRHFIAVAETGSISAAAQTAFISQSTLTLAIQQLEQEIGVNLFNRHAKGMTLTHQGHQFLRQAHLILATVDNAKRSLQQSTDQVAGQLIVGVTSLVAGYYLADLLTRFQRAYPNVEIRVMEDERPYIEHLLVSGKVHTRIKRTYNKFHLLVAEVTTCGDAQIATATEYHCSVTKPFSEQVAQFRMPKVHTVTYLDRRTQQQRVETTVTEFDGEGMPYIASVTPPHLGGLLTLYDFRRPRLEAYARAMELGGLRREHEVRLHAAISLVQADQKGSARQQLALVSGDATAVELAALWARRSWDAALRAQAAKTLQAERAKARRHKARHP